MRALGLNAETIKTPEQGPRTFAAKAVQDRQDNVKKQQASSLEELQQLEKDELAPGEAELPWKFLDGKYGSLGSLPVVVIRDKLLPAVEPLHLSTAKLRSSRDASLSSKHGLLALLEFATGLTPDFLLAGRFKCENRLVALCQRRALDRGRRVLSVSLPPDWVEEGLAFVDSVSDGGVVVENRYTIERVTVAKTECPPFDSIDDLFIDRSFSEIGLALASKRNPSNDGKYMLCNCFKGTSSRRKIAATTQGGTPTTTPRKRALVVVPRSGKKAKAEEQPSPAPNRVQTRGTLPLVEQAPFVAQPVREEPEQATSAGATSIGETLVEPPAVASGSVGVAAKAEV